MGIDITKIAEYGAVGIALTLIMLVAYLVNLFLKTIKNVNHDHEKAYNELKKSINRNTKVSMETYYYLKNKNGIYEKLLKRK